MEVEFPVAAGHSHNQSYQTEFNFDSNCSSPYMTAPSSPRLFGSSSSIVSGIPDSGSFFFSAPPSPTRISSAAFYSDNTSVPFKWEHKPGLPNKTKPDDEFEFDLFTANNRDSLSELSADELFHAGKIRPLKPPPGIMSPSPAASPRSPRSILSRKKEDYEIDPFAAAIEKTRRSRSRSRSLSPLRVSDVVFSAAEEEITTNKRSPAIVSTIMSAFSGNNRKKWRLRDLLLFRSASEGRAPRNDDVLRRSGPKVTSNGVVVAEDNSNSSARNLSFRSTESCSSSVGSVSSRRRLSSAHEIHYTANRAVSEEMKRKTFLPYKQGLLGCLGFSPGVHEVMTRRFGSLSRTSS